MKLKSVDDLMRSAVAEKVFPGAVLLVAHDDEVLHYEAYGWADLFSRRQMKRDTLFDLASLTKPLASAVSIMQLVQQGRADLDGPIAQYCPQLDGTDKGRLVLRHLLSHRSGLPAWRPYYMRLQHLPADKRLATLRHWLILEPLQRRPGEGADYSDLGYMLLQWVVEVITGRSFNRYVDEAIYQPLGIKQLCFPGMNRNLARELFAATELCPWRNRLLVGQVHDDNAYAIGGIAGHAGLFGSARAIYDLLQKLLDAEQGQNRQAFFSREIVQLFFQPQAGSTWALGFDTPSAQGSSSGTRFSEQSIGHLGFSGTSFWVDRRQSVIVVLLTNRIHPTRFNTRIREFRPLLHDCIMAAVLKRRHRENSTP